MANPHLTNEKNPLHKRSTFLKLFGGSSVRQRGEIFVKSQVRAEKTVHINLQVS